ncbi:glycosyltransferase family 4 protein [Pannus brasiliensis]
MDSTNPANCKLKILFIITRADTIGGAQVHVRDLAIFLKANEHSVLVVTGSEGPLVTELRKHQIDCISCQFFGRQIQPVKDWRTFQFIQKVIHRFQPDIISTHSSKAGVIGRLAARSTKTPCIFTAHGWAFTGGVPEPQRTIYQLIERAIEPLADRIICVSRHDRSIGLAVGMRPERLLAIHNGMPDLPRELEANPCHSNPTRIVMIARFDRQKDQETLLKAFYKIPGAHLDLVGEGPTLERIKKLAKDLGVMDRVKFWGFQANVAKILANAQIFTLISHWEGFPRTTIEAMRAGLPVIVSDVGGASEAVVEGITGYSVPRGDVDVLHQKLLELVSNERLRCKMGAEGRKRYEAEFTFDRMFGKTIEVYRQILKENTINIRDKVVR